MNGANPSSFSFVEVVSPDGALSRLDGNAGVVVRRAFGEERCASWAGKVLAARSSLTPAFGGEQFSLGNAFYTHYEEGRSAQYFADAEASDRRVEAVLPRLQAEMRSLVARFVAGDVTERRGWCGAGVHVFFPGGPVATSGGVVHFDIEGLAARHLERRLRALSFVVMLAPPDEGGGLRLWDVLYEGHDHPTPEELRARHAGVEYGSGDLVVIDSYRLHQIQPFEGKNARVSATVHAAETDPRTWTCWF